MHYSSKLRRRTGQWFLNVRPFRSNCAPSGCTGLLLLGAGSPPVVFVGAAALRVAKEDVIRKDSRRLTLKLLAGLGLLALAALLVVALFLPLVSLIASLG